MNLLWHQLKKDALRTRLLVGLWLFFSLLQFSLAGASANPSDVVWQSILTMLAVLTTLLDSLLVMILVPLVIQQEPLVGTTAFWLTRPLSRRLLLAEKSLFLLGLILLPLLVQSVVMLANGVTLHDTLWAAPEFVMGEVTWFLTMAMIAVLTPSFGRFVIACAFYLVFLLTALYLFQIFHIFWASPFVSVPLSMSASRSVISDIVTILFSVTVILCQFFWRRFGMALTLAIVGVVTSSIVSQVWSWNFLQPPLVFHPDAAFDSASITLKPLGAITVSDQVNFRGSEPDKQYSATFDTAGNTSGFLLRPVKFDVTLETAAGVMIPTLPPGMSFFGGNQVNAELLRPILGDMPVVNLSPRIVSTWALFTVSNATYQHYAHIPAKLSMQAHLRALKYVATAELPVRKGAEYRRGSYREEITDVLHETDGVDVLLQVQDVRLNYHLRPDQDDNIAYQMNRTDVIYLLVNRKRQEAIMQKQNLGMNFINFNVSEALQHTPKRIAFGPEDNNSAANWTFPKLDDAWLSDAVLMRIELQPVAEFVKPIVIGNFRLDGYYNNPQDANDYIKYGRAYLSGGDYDSVIASLSKAIQIDPKSVAAYFSRGRAYKLKGNYERALADYTQVIQLDPKMVAAYVNRGQIYNMTGHHDQAIADFDQAIELDPQRPIPYLNRGAAYGATGHYDKAIADFNSALEIAPTFSAAYNNLAWLLATCPQAVFRDGKKAVEDATKACELSQWNNVNQIGTLAAAYAEAGDFDNAVKWENKVLETPNLAPKEAAIAKERLALYQVHKPYHREPNGQSAQTPTNQ